MQTIGAAFGAKKMSVGGESLTLGIWVRVSLDVEWLMFIFSYVNDE